MIGAHGAQEPSTGASTQAQVEVRLRKSSNEAQPFWLPIDQDTLSSLLMQAPSHYSLAEADLICKFLIERGATPKRYEWNNHLLEFVKIFLTRTINPLTPYEILRGFSPQSDIYYPDSQNLRPQSLISILSLLENDAGKSMQRLSGALTQLIIACVFDESVSFEKAGQLIQSIKPKFHGKLFSNAIRSKVTDTNVEKWHFLMQMPIVSEAVHHTFSTSPYNIANQEDLTDFIADPANILEKKYKYLHAPLRNFTSIPRIIHHVWLTHPSAPRELRTEDIENVIAIRKVTNAANKWSNIVWTYKKHLIPNSTQILEAHGIQVREVSELNDNLRTPKPFYQNFVEQQWGVASNIFRQEAVRLLGGFYMDLNWNLIRNVDTEVDKYDFISVSRVRDIRVSICFFGAKPHHPILEKSIDLIHRNFANPPLYISSILSSEDPKSIASLLTSTPLTFGFLLKANLNGNIDCIYPSEEDWQYPYLQNNKDKDVQKNNVCLAAEYGRQIEEHLTLTAAFANPLDREMCLAPHLIIGEDGHNGGTWLNEVKT